ncbi:histidinol-phosphatase HisJ family protein [Acetanaerobacterium elongatum]|uniref:Histidinol-phosphatase n=1 Tax=Acetanaerobacterium elongatum TaxID=258515 RepID=A0A1H0DJD3_9FIRM|nr:histidinol-phosphatase HisJ family protein [Acetanaerobacterium elongatum]SDN70367.1 histidinol-phosphatase (PHP family) [Acetanaerobacterium elongatum]
MSYINLYDSHTHSDNSPDGRESVTYMCENAIAKGLRGISITDHCEMDNFEGGRYNISTKQSYFESLKAKSVFRGSLIVSSGVEIGQPLYNLKLTRQTLASFEYDFVLASMHNMIDGSDYFYVDYSDMGEEEIDCILKNYFKDLLDICNWNEFDCLAHLTYPLRYITGTHGIPVELSRYNDIIDEILKTLARNGKALEINTSGFRQGLETALPPLKYIKRFKELGGEHVTIGSDGHRSEDVGKDIEKGMELAKEAGFEQFTIYLSRTPMLIDIK